MDVLTDLEALLIVAVVAAIAPVVAGLIPGRVAPQVVLLIIGGIVIGPDVLDYASPGQVELIANVGLGFVFLLAGFEIDPALLFARAGRLAVIAWAVALLAALAIVGVLASVGYVRAFVPVALALTTTALGTVLPILKERGMLGGTFGRSFLATGAIGELFPIIAIAVFLGVRSEFAALVSLGAIALIALGLAHAPRFLQGRRITEVVVESSDATGQATLRLSIVLLLGLLVLAGQFGLDVVLGAFLAGMVLRRWTPGEMHAFEAKLDAVGYGFFIPVFFVSAGMAIDIDSIRESPDRLLVFVVLLLAIRGLPALVVWRRVLDLRERVQLVFLSATTLPLIVALTQIGLDSGTMLPENAAALVGAGVLSVMVFPIVATSLHRPAELITDEPKVS